MTKSPRGRRRRKSKIMPLPDLCLLPHEAGDFAPNEPLCAPSIVHVKVSGERAGTYAVRIPNGYKPGKILLARRLNLPDAPLLRFSWNWNSWVTSDKSKNPDKSSKLESYITQLISRAIFNRLISFNTDGRLADSRDSVKRKLRISSLGNTIWGGGELYAPFWWNDVEDWQHLSADWLLRTQDTQIEESIVRMLSDLNSSCSMAWRLSEGIDERNRTIFHVSNGTSKNLEHLWRAILWNESFSDEFWAQNSWQCQLNFFRFNTRSSSSGIKWTVRGMTEIKVPYFIFSERYHHLLELVLSHLGVSVNRDIEKCASIIRSKRWEGYRFSISVPKPTNHEFLESQLLLREFLRDKVSPEELAELMGE